MEQIMALLAQQNSGGRQNNQATQHEQRQNQQHSFAQPPQQQMNQSGQQASSSLLPELLRQLQSSNNAQPPPSLLLQQLRQQMGGAQASGAGQNDSSNPSLPSLASAARRLLPQQGQESLACHGSPQAQQLQQPHANLSEPSLADVLELLQRQGGGASGAMPPPPRPPVAVPSNSMLSPSMVSALQQLAQSRTPASGNTQGTAQSSVQSVQSPSLQASLPPLQRDTTQDLLTNLLISALGQNGGLQGSSIATLLAELGGQRSTEAAALGPTSSATAALPAATGSSTADISDFVRMHLQQQQQTQPTMQRPPPQQQLPPMSTQQQQQQNPVVASAPSPTFPSVPVRSVETGGNLSENPNRASYPLNDITNPGQHDVLFGRGSGASNHLGNIRYRMLITQYKPRYNAASRVDKPKVADEIVHIWRNLSPPGRFLERCDSEEIEEDDDYTTGRWKDVGDKRAKTKTCQCLREKERPRTMRGAKG